MLGSKLIELLLSLSKRRRKELEEYFSLSFIGLNEDARKLGLYLLKLGKQSKEKLLLKEHIEKEVFKDKKIIGKDWNYMNNALFNATNKYLIQVIGKQEDFETEFKLLRFYIIHGLVKNYKAQFNRLNKRLYEKEKLKNRNQDYHYYQFKLKEIEAILTKKNRNKESDLVLVEMQETLKNFSLENRLRLLCEMVNRRNMEEAEYLLNDLKGEISFDIQEHSSIGVLLHCYLYKMLTDSNSEFYYEKVVAIIDRDKSYFGEEYVKTISDYLMNQCAVYINQGRKPYASKYIQFLRQQIREKRLIEGNVVSVQVYKNAVTASLIAEELDWGKYFINAFTQFLPLEEGEGVTSFNLAQIDFQQGNFEEVSNKLVEFQPPNLSYRIAYERLLLKNYLELGEKEAARNRLDSFRQYVYKNEQLSEGNKRKLKNFIKCLKKLLNQEDLTPLLEKMKGELPLIDWMWFQQKAKEE